MRVMAIFSGVASERLLWMLGKYVCLLCVLTYTVNPCRLLGSNMTSKRSSRSHLPVNLAWIWVVWPKSGSCFSSDKSSRRNMVCKLGMQTVVCKRLPGWKSVWSQCSDWLNSCCFFRDVHLQQSITGLLVQHSSVWELPRVPPCGCCIL